jgi:hypothetical protein
VCYVCAAQAILYVHLYQGVSAPAGRGEGQQLCSPYWSHYPNPVDDAIGNEVSRRCCGWLDVAQTVPPASAFSLSMRHWAAMAAQVALAAAGTVP